MLKFENEKLDRAADSLESLYGSELQGIVAEYDEKGPYFSRFASCLSLGEPFGTLQ